MDTIEKIDKAIQAVDDLCDHCSMCSPDCAIAVARRALQGLKYDMQSYAASLKQDKHNQ